MSDPKPNDVPNPETVDPETGIDPSGTPVENPSGLDGADDAGGTRANEPRSDTPWITPTSS